MGIAILPPDIQASEARFSISPPDEKAKLGTIRFGLVAVKNVGEGAVDSMLKARADGPFKTLDDFCARVDLHAANKKVLESLVMAGAMDSLEPGLPAGEARGKLLARLESAIDRQSEIRNDKAVGQGSLFDSFVGVAEPPPETAATAQALNEHDVLKNEKEVLGFYFSGHPLLGVERKLTATATHRVSDLNPEVSGTVRVAGLVNQVKRMVTKSKGEQWARGSLEDLTGEIALLVFPRAYASGLGNQLKAGAFACASGRLSFRGDGAEGAPELIVEELLPLDLAVIRYGKALQLSADASALEAGTLEKLREAFERHPGACPVQLEHETAEGTAVLELDLRVRLDSNLLDSIETILGKSSWRIKSAS